MKHDAVIFDLYGTLVDNPEGPGLKLAAYDRALEETASTIGVPMDEFVRLWRNTTDMRMKGVFPSTEGYFTFVCHELGVHPEADRVTCAARLRLDQIRGQLVPRRDSRETLAQLRGLGYKIGLISDCTWETASLWPGTPLAPLVDAAILSCQVGVRKPDPQIYELACAQLGVVPGRCLYVGDGASEELAGAARMGMEPIRIRVPYERQPDDVQSWSGPEISALAQVFEHLA